MKNPNPRKKNPKQETLTLEEMDSILEDCFQAVKVMAKNELMFLDRITQLEGRISFLEDEYYDNDDDRIIN